MGTNINSDQRPPQRVEASNDAGDWRMHLIPDKRQRVVNKIADSLKMHLPSYGQEGLLELQRIAARFEEKVYAKASSQSDYLRTIAVKVLTMEAKKVNQQPDSTIVMDTNINSDQRPPQRVEPSDDMGDWRTHLMPDSRQRVVNKIMDTLKMHLPSYGQEGLFELHQSAARFEQKVYAAASSQSDYLRTIALKMLTMEAKSVAARPPSNLKRRRVLA